MKNTNKRWTFPSNSYVTNNTRLLLQNLNKVGKSPQVILGHQSTNTLSRNGTVSLDNSDIKAVTGQFPGLVSYDLGRIEQKEGKVWLDGTVKHLIDAIKHCRRLNIPVSLSWHCKNPVDITVDQKNRAANGKVKAIENTVKQILSNETVKSNYISWLDELAAFFEKLVDENGEDIPVLFRPFHECSGNWFWWGANRCSDKEYIALFQFTHDYLSKVKKVDNLLWVYNTDKVNTKEDYMKRYPGDDYVDFCSLDFYDNERYTPEKFKAMLSTSLDVLRICANQQNKGYFIAEGGKKNYKDKNYFTSRCINFFPKDIICFCFWVNSKNNYYVSYPADENVEDFKTMIKENDILLQKAVEKLNLFR